MIKPRVFVTSRWPTQVEHRLATLFQPVFNSSDSPPTETMLKTAMKDYDAMLPTATDTVSSTVLDIQNPRAKIIGNFGAGTTHINVDAARDNGIVVTNTPEEQGECTAEIAITLMLMVARKTGQGERELRSGSWTGWSPAHLVGQQLSGKTLGIVGFGAAGLETARRAHFGFGMKIMVYDRTAVSDEILDQVGAQQVDDIDHLLGQSDFVSLHCPADANNRHLIDALRLNKMKPEAYLINTACSELVDEEALADALWYDTIAGAGLDVFHNEPKINQRLLACENAVLLPHMGSATRETREAMGHRVIDNLVEFFEGREPCDRVA